jgi:hypothetical protein
MMRSLAVASVLLLGVSTFSTTASADRGRGRWGRPDHRPPPVDLGALRLVTTACQNAFEGPTNEQACIATVTRSHARLDVQASITACENAFEGDASELTCLRTMAHSWLAPVAITACENGFEGDANEQSCLDALVGTRYEPSELVRYCEDAYEGDASELACLSQFR